MRHLSFFFRFCVAIIGPEILSAISDNNHHFPSFFENLALSDLWSGASVSENDWGALIVNLCAVIPILPRNAIDPMIKFEIIGGLGPPQKNIN